ncbi:MAG: hypothetical protein C0601_04440 [Candidatus Muiribacterium halophilum]|uniref:Uncharacterized protein n=1 Tax=Muiribacterium halophilum TaxID=2053465 RepID=A0A2N5ZIP6_MUIH1|nr:MAG: hypothetical protein C0601_04440 [Candidatus Muirbacterium halophilum]
MKAIQDAVRKYNKENDKELTKLSNLVPKYLKEIKKDPWGNEYILLPEDGVLISTGPNGKYTPYLFREDSNLINRDNIEIYYKPKLRIAEAKITLDKNKNGRLDTGDRFTIFFTKPSGGKGTGDIDDTQAKPVKVQKNGKDFRFLNDYDPDRDNIREINFSVLLVSKEMLNGDKESDKVVFEVEKLEKNNDNRDIFVCFDPSSTDYVNGTYWDRRGVKAVSNGYAVKIEP